MFDEIFADNAADVVANVSFKDSDGVTHTIKPAIAPKGNLLDETEWQAACSKAGATIASKGKTENGKSVSKSLKDVSAKDARKAAANMFGLKLKAKPKHVESEAEEDTKLENAGK